MKKRIKNIVIIICILCVIVFGLFSCNNYMTETVTREYQLSEISDGVYAYKQTVVSNVPAHNYTIITVCLEDGREMTIKGDCVVVYNDNVKPYAILEDCLHTVRADTITLYVPKNSVEHMGVISSNSR